MYRPTLREARDLAASGEYRRIPVSRELLSDFITPIQALQVLRARSRHCFLLESAADSAGWGRYTFLGFDPTLEITCKDGLLRVGDTVTQVDHPAPTLRQILREHKSPRVPGLPPFTGGLVGYFAYDYLKYAEPSLNLDAEDREQFQDMDLMLFGHVVPALFFGLLAVFPCPKGRKLLLAGHTLHGFGNAPANNGLHFRLSEGLLRGWLRLRCRGIVLLHIRFIHIGYLRFRAVAPGFMPRGTGNIKQKSHQLPSIPR